MAHKYIHSRADEDADLVQFLLRCAEIGYPKSRKQVLALMRRLLLKNTLLRPLLAAGGRSSVVATLT